MKFDPFTGELIPEFDTDVPGANQGVPNSYADPNALSQARSTVDSDMERQAKERERKLKILQAAENKRRMSKLQREMAIEKERQAVAEAQEAGGNPEPGVISSANAEAAAYAKGQADEHQASIGRGEAIVEASEAVDQERGLKTLTDVTPVESEYGSYNPLADIDEGAETVPELQEKSILSEGKARVEDAAIAKNQGMAESQKLTEEAKAAKQAVSNVDNFLTKVDQVNRRHKVRAAELNAQIAEQVKPPSPSVLNLIGVALGGYLSTKRGGPNIAAQLLNQRISRETQTALSNRRLNLQARDAELASFEDERNMLREDFKYQSIANAAGLEGTIKAIDARVAQDTTTQKQKADLLRVRAFLQDKKAQIVQAQLDREYKEEQDRLKLAAKQRRGGGTGSGKVRKTGETVEKADWVWNHSQRRWVNTRGEGVLEELKKTNQGSVQGLGIRIQLTDDYGITAESDAGIFDNPTKKLLTEATDSRQQVAQGVQTVRASLQNLLNKGKGSGVGSVLDQQLADIVGVKSDDVNMFRQDIYSLTNVVKNVSGAGASLTKDELKLIVNSAFGGDVDRALTSWNMGQIKDAVESLQAGVDEKLKAKLATHMRVPVDSITFQGLGLGTARGDGLRPQDPLTDEELAANLIGNVRNKQSVKGDLQLMQTRIDEALSGRGGHEKTKTTLGPIAHSLSESIGMSKIPKQRKNIADFVLQNKPIRRILLSKDVSKELDYYDDKVEGKESHESYKRTVRKAYAELLKGGRGKYKARIGAEKSRDFGRAVGESPELVKGIVKGTKAVGKALFTKKKTKKEALEEARKRQEIIKKRKAEADKNWKNFKKGVKTISGE